MHLDGSYHHISFLLLKTINLTGISIFQMLPGWTWQERTVGRYRLLVLDGHSSHATAEFDKFCTERKIIPLYMLTLDINDIIFECVLDHHNGQLTSRPYSVGLRFAQPLLQSFLPSRFRPHATYYQS
jgi:hypothetical protein